MQITVATIRFDRVLTPGAKLLLAAAVDDVCPNVQTSFQDVPRYTYEISHDNHHGGPRVEYDNLGVMHCAHRNYALGDKDADLPFVDGDTTRRELCDDVLICESVYLYDHGGLTISHSRFDCQWDSGLLGWHYMTKATAKENWPSLEGDALLQAARECLAGELKEYDQYLQGDVYGYEVTDLDGDVVDSCWGYIGDDIDTNGMLDNAASEHHAGLRAAWEKRDE